MDGGGQQTEHGILRGGVQDSHPVPTFSGSTYCTCVCTVVVYTKLIFMCSPPCRRERREEEVWLGWRTVLRTGIADVCLSLSGASALLVRVSVVRGEEGWGWDLCYGEDAVIVTVRNCTITEVLQED